MTVGGRWPIALYVPPALYVLLCSHSAPQTDPPRTGPRTTTISREILPPRDPSMGGHHDTLAEFPRIHGGGPMVGRNLHNQETRVRFRVRVAAAFLDGPRNSG
jgi:hypothetical protein